MIFNKLIELTKKGIIMKKNIRLAFVLKNTVLFFIATICLLSSCTQSKNDSVPVVAIKSESLQQKVITSLSKNVILSTYTNLSDSASALHQQVLILEKNKTQQNLNLAQDAWKKSRLYWESTESFIFGPVESLSIDPLIDTWPLNITDLKSIINSPAPITSSVIRTIGTNLKGFHTIEFILFGDGVQTNQKLITSLTDREIEYLKATTEVLAEDTAKLTYAWTTQADPDDVTSLPYISIIMNPTENKIYGSEQAVIIQLINSMIGIADEVANGKIAGPLGDSLASADPTAEESPFSWNSTTDFANNIKSIRLLFLGAQGNNQGENLGLKSLLDQKNPSLSSDVVNQIDLAIQKIQDIAGPEGTPFGQAILDAQKRDRVVSAQVEVSKLFILLDQKVLPVFQ